MARQQRRDARRHRRSADRTAPGEPRSVMTGVHGRSGTRARVTLDRRASSTQTGVYQDVSECALLALAIAYLEYRGCFVWRDTMSGVTGQSEQDARVGTPGSHAIIGVTPSGRFIAVAARTEEGQLSTAQQIFLHELRSHGAIALEVRPSDYAEHIDEALGLPPSLVLD